MYLLFELCYLAVGTVELRSKSEDAGAIRNSTCKETGEGCVQNAKCPRQNELYAVAIEEEKKGS